MSEPGYGGDIAAQQESLMPQNYEGGYNGQPAQAYPPLDNNQGYGQTVMQPQDPAYSPSAAQPQPQQSTFTMNVPAQVGSNRGPLPVNDGVPQVPTKGPPIEAIANIHQNLEKYIPFITTIIALLFIIQGFGCVFTIHLAYKGWVLMCIYMTIYMFLTGITLLLGVCKVSSHHEYLPFLTTTLGRGNFILFCSFFLLATRVYVMSWIFWILILIINLFFYYCHWCGITQVKSEQFSVQIKGPEGQSEVAASEEPIVQ